MGPPLVSQYTVLFSKSRPDSVPAALYNEKTGKKFPEEEYKYLKKSVPEAVTPVSLNQAGEVLSFDAEFVSQKQNEIIFRHEDSRFYFTSSWQIADRNYNVVKIKMTLKAKEAGYYSMVSPSVIRAESNNLLWGLIPGYFQGSKVENAFINPYFYGQGIPLLPIVVRERTATTLTSIATLKNGITVAAVAAPGYGRVPWVDSGRRQTDWKLGLSLVDRERRISPSLYHPVLGEKDSFLKEGEQREFEVYFVLGDSGWYPAYSYAINQIYQFNKFLDLKAARKSLSDRVLGLWKYVTNDSLSMWRVKENEGQLIGAQSYLGGVYKADQDAMKNADYGAMWMLAKTTTDSSLANDVLKYARNFKIRQQADTGFFKGAPRGQYYLWKTKRYTEEWGDYVEPIAITYYNLMDIGNMLLFRPQDTILKQKLREGAERLISLMKPAGNWAVAYDHRSETELFTDLTDYRPTFYGLVIAYKLLKDQKYLLAAKKGADWFIKNAVERGYYLGVCGDTRFAPDFATAQGAQALLDLYDLTKETKYSKAAVAAARTYSTYIFTHPVPTRKSVYVKGRQMEEWQISQVGLNVEHGGAMGSANFLGPILLSSYSGMFIRFFRETGDSLFLNMARAAALARDGHVNAGTNVASYYWNSMDAGAGPYPHHAWWQIGWITDYLLSEIELRSNGRIYFPAGFMAPKVGPHKTYGFVPGTVYGAKASLILPKDYVQVSNPDIEFVTAADESNRKLFVIFLNSSNKYQAAPFRLNGTVVSNISYIKPAAMNYIDSKGRTPVSKGSDGAELGIGPFGIKVLEVSY